MASFFVADVRIGTSFLLQQGKRLTRGGVPGKHLRRRGTRALRGSETDRDDGVPMKLKPSKMEHRLGTDCDFGWAVTIRQTTDC